MINDETKYLYHPESRDIYKDELESHKRCLQSRNIRPLLDMNNFHNANDPANVRFQKHMAICPVCQSVYDKEIELRNFISEVVPVQKIATDFKVAEIEAIADLMVKHHYFSPFWSRRAWAEKMDITLMYLRDIADVIFSRRFVAGMLLATFVYTFLKLVNF